jgi:hypothetical protein
MTHTAGNDARGAPMSQMFPRLRGTRLVCLLFGHVWAPEWWAREQFSRSTVCLRCRVFPPEGSAS